MSKSRGQEDSTLNVLQRWLHVSSWKPIHHIPCETSYLPKLQAMHAVHTAQRAKTLPTMLRLTTKQRTDREERIVAFQAFDGCSGDPLREARKDQLYGINATSSPIPLAIPAPPRLRTGECSNPSPPLTVGAELIAHQSGKGMAHLALEAGVH